MSVLTGLYGYMVLLMKLSISFKNLKKCCGKHCFLFCFFFFGYKLDLAVGFGFRDIWKKFFVLYHWILFIACLHDNICVSMR